MGKECLEAMTDVSKYLLEMADAAKSKYLTGDISREELRFWQMSALNYSRLRDDLFLEYYGGK